MPKNLGYNTSNMLDMHRIVLLLYSMIIEISMAVFLFTLAYRTAQKRSFKSLKAPRE